ncbi:hypothetical protein [uncultured Flavobacterium sp.]|uniref:hypothetical protein n=1 Tax=uncultured Flavobacterium sp. TaxID=165435 RepID=UPI0030ECF267|tara:strand:- start:145571 stop:146317 length:747 start_codon:yes stop_codon:yes gene_type:complete
MKLNNFEKQVQQKLSNREIKPSANSWDRLDAMLSVEDKPKKKGFFWINIAASFIVLASIGYYFYNQNEVLIPAKEDSIIVEVENKKEVVEEVKEARNEKQEEVLVENDNKLEKSNQVVNQKISNTSKINIQQLAINNQTVSIINQSKEDNNNKVSVAAINNQQLTSKKKYISAEKLLAEVSNTKFENKSSEKEIKNIKKRISVNPNTLLSNAETEIYQSFRENALERLNKNYNAIKTVLANRNYEDEL